LEIGRRHRAAFHFVCDVAQQGEKMTLVTGQRVPSTAAEIDAAWLSKVLGKRFPGAIATAVNVVDAHSGTTGRARLRVEWEGDPATRVAPSTLSPPAALFAKFAPSDPLQKEIVISTGMGKREAQFFDGFADEIPVRVPSAFWSGWNEAGDAYIMLMEDLLEAGCRFPNSRDDNPLHPERMMDALGRLHGHYWEDPRFGVDDSLAWIEPPMRHEMGPLLVASALEQFGDQMPEPFRDLAELYVQHTDAINDFLDAGPRTLLHGDSHLGNTFVDGDQVGLLDWACIAYGPGLRDFAYYICNSLPVKRRQRDEGALLRRYLETLARCGGPRLEEKAATDLYRRYAITSWVAATVTAAAGDRMQPLEIGIRAMERATAAICDLDTARLLRDELGV
jgi:hypothetical protein